MADFCMDCSLDIFGQDSGDFAGIVTKEQHEQDGLVAVVLCEGCGGNIRVDHEGRKVPYPDQE